MAFRNQSQVSLGYMERETLKRQWSKVLTVACLMLVTLFIAVLFPNQLKLVLIGLPVVFFGAFVLLRWPAIGFIALVSVGLLKFTYIPLIEFPAVVIFAMTGLWLFKMIAYDRQLKFVATPSVTAVHYFIAIVLISFLIGQLPWFPVKGAQIETQIGGIIIFLTVFFLFLLAANQIRDIRWLKTTVYVLCAFGAIFSLAHLSRETTSLVLNTFSRNVAGGSLFRMWIVILPLSMALYNKKLPAAIRLLFLLAAGNMMYFGMIVNPHWVSGWVPSLVAVGTLLWVGAPRLAIPLTASAGVFLSFNHSFITNTLTGGDNTYSTISRLDAWRIMGEIIKVNPLFGLGPSNYYFYTPLYNILGFYVEFNSHNNYVDLLAQTGILGLLCFLWFCWTIGTLGWRLRRQVPKGGFAHAYVLACLAGLGGTVVAGMLGDWVIPFYYNIGTSGLRASGLTWLFWGGMVALSQMMLNGSLSKPTQFMDKSYAEPSSNNGA